MNFAGHRIDDTYRIETFELLLYQNITIFLVANFIYNLYIDPDMLNQKIVIIVYDNIRLVGKLRRLKNNKTN